MSERRVWRLKMPRLAIPFPELTYASPEDPWLKRTVIRTIELLSGRNYFAPLYDIWRREVIPSGGPVMRPVFDLIDVKLEVLGVWPPLLDPAAPLVIVANHPYGFLDGFAALALAEDLGRPFRVLINKDLMKVPEIRPYSLPVDFAETRQAQQNNIRMRNEAIRLLKEGTTVIVFPGGGVATSPTPFGRAVDLPWKTFTARMIQAARAQVLPVYFEGQCGPLFHAVSWISLTLRLSLIVAEFRRLVGTTFRARVGELIPAAQLAAKKDRLALMTELYERVHGLSDTPLEEVRARTLRLPAYLRGTR
ncbi:MAG TPA: lysophospholipid acyltransferase family protein [Hyphomicrobiaceae bacterium]|nr:lysophospholipid acyltransferase family protein [Hyphomicrobiaceae bacterium]